MCELFGMSSACPTDVRLSMKEFARRGGESGPHRDGWGVAYYQDGDVQLIRETEPAASSACAKFLQENPFRSDLVIAHLRLATQGPRALRNCQPFVRELGGFTHCFAHNGKLDAEALSRDLPADSTIRPVGDTDSEIAFCVLLEHLRPLYRAHSTERPPLDDRHSVVAAFATRLRMLGPANFLYSDGEVLIAHGHRRTQSDHTIKPPGLFVIERHCGCSTGLPALEGIDLGAGSTQHVALFASVPLTNEAGWRALNEGEIVIARGGAAVEAA